MAEREDYLEHIPAGCRRCPAALSLIEEALIVERIITETASHLAYDAPSSKVDTPMLDNLTRGCAGLIESIALPGRDKLVDVCQSPQDDDGVVLARLYRPDSD